MEAGRMNRSELVRAVAERAGGDEAVARRHVDAVFEAVMDAVSAGERVVVTGFGAFDRSSRAARSARNPRTGAPVEVPAALVPTFRFGQTFRNRVAGTTAPAPASAAEAAAPAEPAPAAEDAPAQAKKPKKGKKAAAKKEGAKKAVAKKAVAKEAAAKETAVKAPKKGKKAAAAEAAPKKKSGKGKARAKSGK
ncbi:HU family DNA-binding protein [Actinomadura verrucosospora]|uniref:HU family DNA-binding protein n=1 Tax=Actinomadura verrucosospora TaxID=46165 RepID=UPI0031B5F21F